MDDIVQNPGRRRALKVAGGVAAAAVVWSEPTIKGLARRPAYANAASGDGQNCAFEAGTYNLVNGCVTVGGTEICATKAMGNNFRLELSDGCTWDQSLAAAVIIVDNQGDEGTVDLIAGDSVSTFATGNLNGNIANSLIVIPDGVTFSCP